MKKFELIDETREIMGVHVYRIRALCDFGKIKEGDLGGFVESERNLSHDGKCFIKGQAVALGETIITDDSIVCGTATVVDSKIYDSSYIIGSALIVDSIIRENVYIRGFYDSTPDDEGKVKIMNCHLGGLLEVYPTTKMVNVTAVSAPQFRICEGAINGQDGILFFGPVGGHVLCAYRTLTNIHISVTQGGRRVFTLKEFREEYQELVPELEKNGLLLQELVSPKKMYL